MDPIEERTRAFYEWECLGRGWIALPYRVPLEPPFRPFIGPAWRAPTRLVDDGKQPTLLSRFVGRLRGEKTALAPRPAVREEPDLWPHAADITLDLCERTLLIPDGTRVDDGLMDAWLRGLLVARHPVSLELVGSRGVVTIRVCCATTDAGVVFAPMRSLLAGVVLDESEPLIDLVAESLPADAVAVEFGLGREFMIPLRQRRPPPDPLAPFVGALSDARSGEVAVVQVLFQPARAPWPQSITRAVTTPEGEPFFLDAPEITDLAREKIASPLFAAATRLAVIAQDSERAWQLAQGLCGAFAQWTSVDRNQLVPLASESVEKLVEDIVSRTTHRSGMLISAAELASIARFPGDTLLTIALKREREAEVLVPAVILGDTGVVLGRVTHRGEEVEARLGDTARLAHVHVIGASGTGKSTLLQSLILQDIEVGHGVGVLDPHGDLVDAVLARIPAGRLNDVVLFDPADPEYVVGWNILGARSEVEKELLASDLVAVFRRLSTSWGDQMTTVLGNAVLAFLESNQGGTLQDLRKFLLDEKFRASFLNSVGDDHVASFWRQEFPLLVGKKPQAPILTRLDTFLRSRLVRDVVTEREKPLDFRAMIDSGKVFLARLSQGTIGEENAALLGALLVSKFHQVSLSRQDQAEGARRPFFLYIDEFQQLATPSMASLFSGVRKYRLGLTVAHQDLFQLHKNVPEVERAVLANAHTRIAFRVADEDARKLERSFGQFTAADLANLGTGQAIGRVGRSEDSFRLSTVKLPALAPDEAERRQAEVRRIAMLTYGRRRDAVKAATQWVGAPAEVAQQKHEPAPAKQAEAQPKPATVESVAEQTKETRSVAARSGSQPGRGGGEHKYLQSLIKQWGEAQGFKAEIEKEIEGGKRIDIALCRGETTIAVEIAMTTSLDWEIGNVEKGLSAGYGRVVVVSLSAAFLRRLGRLLDEKLPAGRRELVQLLSPEEFFAFLETQAPTERVTRVAGYKVSVRTKLEQATAADARKKAVAEVLLRSVRRLRA